MLRPTEANSWQPLKSLRTADDPDQQVLTAQNRDTIRLPLLHHPSAGSNQHRNKNNTTDQTAVTAA